MFKRAVSFLLAGLIAVPMLTLAACSKSDSVVIGSKDFTENKILGEMMAQLIEKKTNIKVVRKLSMGGTFVCFQAIKKGQIDIYPEYTGTALTAQLGMKSQTDPDKVYQIVSEKFEKKYHIAWLKTFGFNNTYALAVTSDYAKKNRISTISDLVAKSKNLVFGAEHEFFNRDDGYSGLIKTYGLKFKSVSKMDVSLKYEAVAQGKIQCTDAFTTDGQLKALHLAVLKDNQNFFPPYYAAPIIRDSVLKAHPELKKLLNSLAGKLGDSTMQELNYEVDNQKKSVASVASAFLKKEGLL